MAGFVPGSSSEQEMSARLFNSDIISMQQNQQQATSTMTSNFSNPLFVSGPDPTTIQQQLLALQNQAAALAATKSSGIPQNESHRGSFPGFGGTLSLSPSQRHMMQSQLDAWRQTFPSSPLLSPRQGIPSSGLLPMQNSGGLLGSGMPPASSTIDSNSVLGSQGLQSVREGSSVLYPEGDLLADDPRSTGGRGSSKLTGRKPALLYMTCDDDSLSEYQCLVRKQIELFEARQEEVESNAKGRNKPIVLGQVGIRCRHCSMLPPRQRTRGAMYYPAKLNGLYQAAQSMASGHFCYHCHHIPDDIRQELLVLKERKSSAGGGKKYWGDGVRVLGVYEGEDGLRFEKRHG